jgi:hypothetical protein
MSTNSTSYYNINGSSSGSSSKTGNAITPGVAETLTSLTFTISSAASFGTYTATVGSITGTTWSATPLTCSIPTGQTSCTITTNASVAANQSINVQVVTSFNSRVGTWTTTYTQP